MTDTRHDLNDFRLQTYDCGDDFHRDGYVRRIFMDGAYFTPDSLIGNPEVDEWFYGVTRYPFVPGYNLIKFVDVRNDQYDHIISNHKTLSEALALLRLLLTTPGAVKYVDD